MAEAARWCAGQGARIIDINFGCPAKKVTSGLSGSALMREPDLALRLIEAVVGAVEVPVTVKMRLGWDDALDERARDRRARRGGRAWRMVTVHGRTRCQFYDGARRLGGGRARSSGRCAIPVIVNGDIVDAADGAAGAGALRRRRGDGRARARAAGPGCSAQIAAALAGRPRRRRRRRGARASSSAATTRRCVGFYGRDLGVRVARKHLGWYLDGVAGAAAAARPADGADRPATRCSTRCARGARRRCRRRTAA